jgi:Flp pilus assembly secretin CpaC
MRKKDKQVTLQVRILESERDAFVKLCESLDTNASREVRAFVRNYLKKHAQQNLL